jgi:hypothetical protein
MVKTRSKGNERDRRSRTNINLATKKLVKHQEDLNSISKGSNSSKKSSASSSNTASPSPLRRSTRETPTKRIAHLSGTAPGPSPSPSNKKKNLTSKSSPVANPSSKKTASMEKIKSFSGGSSPSMKSPKNKSKGKDKVQAEGESTQTCKRNLKSILNASSPLSAKEEGSSTKRQRLLLHADTYKGFFKPRTKISNLSPPGKY